MYIITTKAAGFTKRLLEKVDISVPDDKIFGQGSGKKWATIQKLLAVHPGCNAFFLEDRLKGRETSPLTSGSFVSGGVSGSAGDKPDSVLRGAA